MSNHKIGLSGIESQEDVTLGKKQKEDISRIIESSVPQRHSYFQLRYFVIGKEPTNQSKMWQCIREIKTRKESLESIELEVEEQSDMMEMLDIEEKVIKMEETKVAEQKEEDIKLLKQKENKLKIKKIKRKKEATESNIIQLLNKKKYIEEELAFLVEMFKALEKVEPLKDLDDLESQKAYWSERLAQKLNMKMLLGAPLESELVETIVALPDDMSIKKQIINTLAIKHEQIIKKLEGNKGNSNGN